MIDWEKSAKAIINSKEFTDESIAFWCKTEHIDIMSKEEFVDYFDDFSEEGITSLIMAISFSDGISEETT